ncbi:polysaccharide pyruvyl transferase [Vibrio nigripulchritudo ATCC 27043]|uniref:polysaccharide pyruvyl transferase family protein n=1 Tax=Vibrio nigripulchritudo TaxID=28173 RepID=UPI00021C189F|nr:polysaccharide pyruvyl transferase family protein [Vibrio nigripulchritudo]EGU56693.1 polysaccharide pyruvyl transferase [Vibrio nigripulchritudo ATCC 27043]
MKIATVTYHDGINYGAYWQASCLAQFLKSLGHEVYIVDYKPKSLKYNELKTLFFTKRINLLIKNYFKLRKFRSYQKENFELVEVDRINDLGIEILVFGADEIWNFTNPLIGLELTFFGKVGTKSQKKISYAPSFGTVDRNKRLPEEVVNALSDFEHITTRDLNSESIISKCLERQTDIVCDPVFLCDIDKIDLIEYQNTIVIYSTGLPDVFIRKIKAYADEKNLKVIAIGYRIAGIESLISLSPSEFIDILSSSKMVVTSMFHGVMFSLKFNKQFLIYEDLYRRNKLETVVERLRLNDRFVDESSIVDKLDCNLDYERVNSVLEEWIKCSQDKLKEMIRC